MIKDLAGFFGRINIAIGQYRNIDCLHNLPKCLVFGGTVKFIGSGAAVHGQH